MLSWAALCWSASAGDAFAAESLELFPNGRWLAIHFVILLALIWPVRRWLLDPLARVLQERESRTEGALSSAADLRQESADLADRIEQDLRTARAEAQRARGEVLAEAEDEERKILDLARSESARAVAAVRDRIERELEEARTAMAEQSGQLAREAASRILGRPL